MERLINDIMPTEKRVLLGRVVFSFILFSLFYSLLSHTLFHQLQSPVLKYPYVDPAYWIMHLLRVPDIIVSDPLLSYSMDAIMFITCAGCIVFPSSRVMIIVFMVVYFIYFITINSYGGHHTHSRIGILLAPVPFLFRKPVNFSLMWQALRYYTLFIYASAFLWKILRLTFLNADHGILIMKNNLAPYIFYNPGAALTNFYLWLLQHPTLVNSMYILGIVAEGIFIIGFFTRKYDRCLLFLSVVLITGFWFFADALFFQLLILSFTFINFKRKISHSSV